MSPASTKGSPTVTSGKDDFPAQHRIEQAAFAEVLREPAAAHDRPLDPGVLNHLLCPLCLLFSASGKKHDLVHPVVCREFDKHLDGLDRARSREVREEVR